MTRWTGGGSPLGELQVGGVVNHSWRFPVQSLTLQAKTAEKETKRQTGSQNCINDWRTLLVLEMLHPLQFLKPDWKLFYSQESFKVQCVRFRGKGSIGRNWISNNPSDVFTGVFHLNYTNCCFLLSKMGPFIFKYFIYTSGAGPLTWSQWHSVQSASRSELWPPLSAWWLHRHRTSCQVKRWLSNLNSHINQWYENIVILPAANWPTL